MTRIYRLRHAQSGICLNRRKRRTTTSIWKVSKAAADWILQHNPAGSSLMNSLRRGGILPAIALQLNRAHLLLPCRTTSKQGQQECSQHEICWQQESCHPQSHFKRFQHSSGAPCAALPESRSVFLLLQQPTLFPAKIRPCPCMSLGCHAPP